MRKKVTFWLGQARPLVLSGQIILEFLPGQQPALLGLLRLTLIAGPPPPASQASRRLPLRRPPASPLP